MASSEQDPIAPENDQPMIDKKNENKDSKHHQASHSSSSDNDESHGKRHDSTGSKLKKESKERHRDHDRHRPHKESSSSSRHKEHRTHKSSSSHRKASHKERRHRDDESSSRHKESSRHNKDSRSDRDSHRRHDRDRHSDRHRHRRSKSASSSDNSNTTDSETYRRKERDCSRDRKYSRRDRSDSRDRRSHHDRDRKYGSKSERSEKSKYHDNRSSEITNQSKNIEEKKVNIEPVAKIAEVAPVLTNADGTPNVAEILKSIKIPPELRLNQMEASKYQMEQLRVKTEEITGVKVPSFYSTTAVNPLAYAEQQKKRKLLWSKAKDNGTTTTSLVGRAIVQGTDEKTSEKFRKLMGIKSTDSAEAASDTVKMQLMHQKAFEAMDKEYEMARMTTHTHRGQGLGFATTGLIDPNQPQRPAQ